MNEQFQNLRTITEDHLKQVSDLLCMMLQVAVPLWIADLRCTNWTHIEERAKACANMIASEGDTLMYKTEGQTAHAFNRLAEGIACLAFAPGGVTVFGQTYEAKLEATLDPKE